MSLTLMEIPTTSTEKGLPNRKPIRYGKLSSSGYFADPPSSYKIENPSTFDTPDNSSTFQKSDYIRYFKSMSIKINNEDQISVLLNKNKKLRRSLIEILEDLNSRYELSIQLLDDNVTDYGLQEIEVLIRSKEITDDFFDEIYALPEKYFEQINASDFRIIISCDI